ncbi:MAG: DUF1648 domain-containing protein [Aeriscardovia sp.]|nr:DUF1648 domain-containing protein [Aeriscardovia sp.]MBR3463049.1 DUF1648 domain-containing protein [Clostridiales bacterium]
MRKTTNIISIVMILLYIAFLAIGWKNFPAELPTHFNASGAADEFGPKSSLLVEPAAMIGLFLLLAIVERFPKLWNIPADVIDDNEENVLNTCFMMFGILKIVIILVCAFAGFMCIYPGFPSWTMYLAIGVILLTIVVSTVKIYGGKLG